MRLVPGKAGGRLPSFTLALGECVEQLAELPSSSVDAIVSDPPYPEVDRDYGRLTEDEWHILMRRVVGRWVSNRLRRRPMIIPVVVEA